MADRKVLNKYYPPDFDPSKLERRNKKPKDAATKLPTIRLMAPFSMKCTACGEYIYKGRKFNARKEITDEKYYAISIIRFYIKCTRCSAEITFKTDPKHNDYESERGCRRNFEPWRQAKLEEETEEEMLDRLEKEENERDAMKELEKKTVDAKTEMAVADALDDVRLRNAARERKEKGGPALGAVEEKVDEEEDRFEREIAEQARKAFRDADGVRVKRLADDETMEPPEKPASSWQRKPKPKKKDALAAMGIKRKAPRLGL